MSIVRYQLFFIPIHHYTLEIRGRIGKLPNHPEKPQKSNYPKVPIFQPY